ncbi:MAG: OB-fold nucleic acid binding domain-containing protein, partial [Chloroflexota bacterium]|nr:OB-fold nucleic acid binding domain-containing protein [Chloroflexota bacterium]
WVRIEGVVWEYKGEREIKVYKVDNVQWLGPGEPVKPTKAKTGEVGEVLEGKLVQVTGRITRFGSFYLDDGSGEVEAYIRRGTGIELKGLKVGQIVTVVGVVGRFGSTYEIRPRSQADIQPMLLPKTGGSPSMIEAILRAVRGIFSISRGG